MAGALTISTLNNDAGVLATQNGMTGIAKAWVRFTGSTGAIIGAFNVSSVTRSSTGIYIVNFTTAMANANYAVSCPIAFVSGSNYCTTLPFISVPGTVTYTAPTTSAFFISTVNLGGATVADPLVVCASVNSN